MKQKTWKRDFLRFALGVSAQPPMDLEQKDWQWLLRFGVAQAIPGVIFNGMNRLRDMGVEIPEEILGKGITGSMAIEKRNKKVNGTVMRLVQQFEADGFRCCLLKGQGNCLMYPNVYNRVPGDIDLWVLGKDDYAPAVQSVISYVRSIRPKAWAVYHHIEYGMYEGVEVEVHYRPSFITTPLYNRRLQKWFTQEAPAQLHNRVQLPGQDGTVAIPTTEFNAVFQLAHIYTHLLNQGIVMRQIIDYYYVLLALEDRQKVQETIKWLGLEKIAAAMMWLLQRLFDLPEEKMLVEPNEAAGRILSKDLMKHGQSKGTGTGQSWIKKNLRRLQRDVRMVRYFPSECLWEPLFRIWHFFWRLTVGRNL